MGQAARAKHRANPTHTRSRTVTGVLVVVALGVGVSITAAVAAALMLNTSREANAAGSAGSVPGAAAASAAPAGDTSDRLGQDSVSRAQRPAPSDAQPRFAADAPMLLLGDSLALGIGDPVAADSPQRAVTVEAEVGRSTSTSAYLLADHVDATGPVWVVSLGTNDSPEEFPAAAREVLRLAGPDRCVLWFDIHRPERQGAINATLSRLALRTPNLHLLGWAAMADAHPEWFSWDGIHPNSAGAAARATLATGAVARSCTTGGGLG